MKALDRQTAERIARIIGALDRFSARVAPNMAPAGTYRVEATAPSGYPFTIWDTEGWTDYQTEIARYPIYYFGEESGITPDVIRAMFAL